VNDENAPIDVEDALESMLTSARSTMSRAYAPYSNFHVGAAVLNEDGGIRPGANVENASYPLSVCAERNAAAAMVAAGERRIEAVAVVADAPEPVTPCGGCRQVLAEFADAEVPVFCELVDGKGAEFTVGGLLPSAFAFER